MKIAVQITDINLNPGINAPPYCIGRDRGGRVYSPIWFTDTDIPAQFSLHWIEPHGRKWMLGSKLIGQTSLEGLGIGDKKILAENLYLDAAAIIINSSCALSGDAPVGTIKFDDENDRLYVMTSDGWKYVLLIE